MKTKLLSMLLALSMMLTMLAACNTDEPVVDDSPDGQQKEEQQGDGQGGEEVVSDVLNLVVDGVSDYVIVRGENAYISEVTASTELQSYLKQISGVEIPIVTDATAPVEKEIVVGKTNREADGEFDREELGDDGLVIKTNGQKLFLVGGEQRGTLYAVYEFLESYLGCRFFTGEVEKIPEQKIISIEQIAEDKQIPVFEVRNMTAYIYGYGATNNIGPKRKLNGNYAATGTSDIEAYGGYAGRTISTHSFSILVPPSVYYAEHPEYFSIEMSEEDMASDLTMGQPCLTNPDVLAIAIDSARRILKEDPKIEILSVSQNDNQNYCKCDNCMQAYAEENNSHAGVLLRFVNAVATALKDEFPDVLFETLAYQYTRTAPTVTKPADNVMVRLCTIECCFSHPLGTCEDANKSGDITKNIYEDIQDWGKICNNVAVWDYTVNFSHFSSIYPNFNVIRENMKFFAENNTVQIFQEGHAMSDSFEFGELRAYLLAKLYWDPYMSEEEFNYHMNDFLQYNYGAGWEYLRQYIDLSDELTEDKHFSIGFDVDFLADFEKVKVNENSAIPEDITVDMIKNYETVDWSKYWNFYHDIAEEPAILSEGERLFALAYEAAETDAEKARIEKISLQLDYIRSYYLGTRISYGNSAVGKIVGNFMQAHPEDFTQQEQIDYRRSIIKLANEQVREEYKEFNYDMLMKMMSYGNQWLHSKYITQEDISSLNLGMLPEDWYN